MNQIKQVVDKVKDEISVVSKVDGLCYYASNNILFDLENANVPAQMFNAKDVCEAPIDHYFVIAKEDDTYLIDTTYFQFVKNGTLRKFNFWPAEILKESEEGKELLEALLNKGYSKIDDELLYTYLSSFNKDLLPFFTLEDLFSTKTR